MAEKRAPLTAPLCRIDDTRLYLRKLRELKKLKRYRHVALAGSRVFIRAVQQVNGWENKPHIFASSAVLAAS